MPIHMTEYIIHKYLVYVSQSLSIQQHEAAV